MHVCISGWIHPNMVLSTYAYCTCHVYLFMRTCSVVPTQRQPARQGPGGQHLLSLLFRRLVHSSTTNQRITLATATPLWFMEPAEGQWTCQTRLDFCHTSTFPAPHGETDIAMETFKGGGPAPRASHIHPPALVSLTQPHSSARVGRICLLLIQRPFHRTMRGPRPLSYHS